MQNIFYDAETKKEIVDVSGIKTKEEIAKEFSLNEQNITTITITPNNEYYEIVGNKLQKKDKEIITPKSPSISISESLEIIAKLKDATSFDDFKSKATSTEVKEK